MEEFIPPDDIAIIGRHSHHHARNDDPPRVGHLLCRSKVQIRKKFTNKGMNRETKTTSKIGLVKTNFISIGVTCSLLSLGILIFTESGN